MSIGSARSRFGTVLGKLRRSVLLALGGRAILIRLRGSRNGKNRGRNEHQMTEEIEMMLHRFLPPKSQVSTDCRRQPWDQPV